VYDKSSLTTLSSQNIRYDGSKRTGDNDVGRILQNNCKWSPPVVFTNMANNLLRAEGDAKRSMYAIILGAVINIILDPIFIYLFRLGVLGAAWATLISISITTILLFIWLFLKRNTYISLRLSEFSPDRLIIGEILRVGIPATLSMISMSVTMYLLNIIIIKTAGTNGVAVFTSGWRIVSLGTIPLMGIATGVTAVTATAYGEKNPRKLQTAYLYGIVFELS
jgi:putative MATE family efflux protein